MLDDGSILITGGTGSFGRALTREVLRRSTPRRLVILSRDEQMQYRMAQDFPPEEHPSLRFFIGDVRDRERLRRAMDGIDFVVHAAAMKHVPIAEYNPFECIRTNVGGAENVINAAIDAGVRRVVALSTDKAANPINLYGATKLASDKCFIAANHLAVGSGTRFSVVRYGNVIGSRGSVVEHFRKLVQRGATELPITDREMTRFWITLHQGVEFVLARLADMEGGELFVPKIPSVRVADVARAIGPRCKLKSIGIRPGEKLHEVLLPYDEARNTLEYGAGPREGYYLVQPSFHWWRSKASATKEGGRPVDPNFHYWSKDNAWKLSTDDLKSLLEEGERHARAFEPAA